MRSGIDVSDDIREFLTTRRAKITPQQAGLPDYGGRRRVQGLRRAEVARLADISVEYYTRLERGNVRGVSDDVVECLARALRLDEVERAHLFNLVRTANASPAYRRPPTPRRVGINVQQLLDAMTGAAAFVRNGRLDVLAANHLGRALYAEVLAGPERPANLARFIFLKPSAGFYRDWANTAGLTVGSLRNELGRNPGDPDLAELIAELSESSEEFRAGWGAHDVTYYRSGIQTFHHPMAGDLDLDYEALELPAHPGLTIIAYTAAPGSDSRRALDLLASWTAAPAPEAVNPLGSAARD
ncbi:helix-turn-helix transcriptional regulator [Streptomyces sp. YIM S03343]